MRYLGSTYLPGRERLLSLFEAATADAVRTVSESSQAPASDLEAAIVLPPPVLSGAWGTQLPRSQALGLPHLAAVWVGPLQLPRSSGPRELWSGLSLVSRSPVPVRG